MDNRPEDGFMERPRNADGERAAKANARFGGRIGCGTYLRHKASLHEIRDDRASIGGQRPEALALVLAFSLAQRAGHG